jgi:hypothetical protein
MDRTTNPWNAERPRRTTSQACFTSAKTAAPIRFEARVVHKALVQLSLNPTVGALEFIPSAEVSGTHVLLNAIVVCQPDGRRLLDVVEARRLRDLDDEALSLLAIERLGLEPLTITPAELRRQPYASNCCLVWNCRNLRVHASDRVRILHAVAEDGPMTLGRIASEARWTTDAVGAVLSMACQDLVEIDLEATPLGPETIVRRRTAEGETR